MSVLGGMKEKLGRVKGAEWALLLIVVGLAGSLLLSPGASLLAGGGGGEQTAGQQGMDALEARTARVLSGIEGAGRVDVVIHYAQPAVATGNWLEPATAQPGGGEPVGAVVVAEGAGDLTVRLELARAVQTLLQLSADAVEVFKMGSVEQGE